MIPNNETPEHSVSDEMLQVLADKFYGRGSKAAQREAELKLRVEPDGLKS